MWAQSHPDLSVDESWSRLVGTKGMLAEGAIAGLAPGGRYRFRAATGDDFAGEVLLNQPGSVFAGTVESLNDGLLRYATERLGGQTWTMIWLATYGIDRGRVAVLQARMDGLLAGLFGTRRS